MRKILLITCFLTGISLSAFAQSVPVYKASALMERVAAGKDTLYVLNFWATWCVPCVKELPEFDKLHSRYQGKPVSIIMVSLDFPDALPKKLPGFIHKKKLRPEVIWLDETNANEFIPKIEPEWQGSIPATLMIHPGRDYRKFFEGTVTAAQLQLLIDKQLSF